MNDQLRILIVDDDRRMVKTLVDILKVKGYQAEAAYSGEEALEMIGDQVFDCVLTDIRMPGVNGIELQRAIKAKKPELLVVLMTAYATNALVREGLDEGALASLTKPLDINLLLGFFSSLRKERSIVIVDDDSAFCKTLGDVLRTRGFDVIEVTDPHDLVNKFPIDDRVVVLLDMKLNSIDGLDVIMEIKQQAPHVPVILVTGYRDEMSPSIEAALELEAYTCLYKPLQIEELLQVLTEVHHMGLGKKLGRVVGGSK